MSWKAITIKTPKINYVVFRRKKLLNIISESSSLIHLKKISSLSVLCHNLKVDFSNRKIFIFNKLEFQVI